MSTTRPTGPRSGDERRAATKPPTDGLPSPEGEESKDVLGSKRVITRLPDYDDNQVKERWKKIIDRQREELETDVLQITKPRAKLDPIAQGVLDVLCARLISRGAQTKEGSSNKSATPDELEKQVRAFIVSKGIASEVKKVTQRLNARRMTDGRRWVLRETYVLLLARLFQDKMAEIEDARSFRDNRAVIKELVDDDLGVAEKVMLDLEAEDGPLDVFASLIVKTVMKHNRIGEARRCRNLWRSKYSARSDGRRP